MICDPCKERADRADRGCGQDCGTQGCTCLHRGGGNTTITQGEFARLLREELVGLQINTTELARAVERLRARYCHGQVLRLILPGHDHPHVLTEVDLLSGNNPFEIEVATRVDPCPAEVTLEESSPKG